MRRSGHGISNAGQLVVVLSGSTPGKLHSWVLIENTGRKSYAEFLDSTIRGSDRRPPDPGLSAVMISGETLSPDPGSRLIV